MISEPLVHRDTPLAIVLKARIRREGPISVRDYITACLQDETHGYYRSQRAIGQDADFVTAPEISQIFGELIGLWAAVVWQQMGQPERFDLIELGPGRGTLMADALRATRIVPGFREAARICFVESNATLRAVQRKGLGDLPSTVVWLRDVADIDGNSVEVGVSLNPGPAPAIIIANEFLDAMPARQWIKADDGAFRERGVGIDDAGQLMFQALGTDVGAPPSEIHAKLAPEAGAIIEEQEFSLLVDVLARLASRRPLAALFIDYGHLRSASGDTLQAVRGHRHEPVLTSPGEADLSMQVDFAHFTRMARVAAEQAGAALAVDGPTTQAEFLGALGIAQRASRLMAANPERAASLEQDVARLMAPEGMGTRFKVIGLRSIDLQPLPALPVIDIARDTS